MIFKQLLPALVPIYLHRERVIITEFALDQYFNFSCSMSILLSKTCFALRQLIEEFARFSLFFKTKEIKSCAI